MDESMKGEAAMDQLVHAVRENFHVPWDEVREARVLSKILEASEFRAAPLRASAPAGRRNRMSLFILAAAAAAALAAAGAVTLGRAPQATPAPELALVEKAQSTSEITFAAGTRALLEPGAHAATVTQTDALIELKQSKGRVAYEVNPEREQTFRVQVDGVTIEVVGTKFLVDVSDEAVLVSVSHGVVSVREEGRELLLRGGEHVSIARHAPKPEQPVRPVVQKRSGPAQVGAVEPASDPVAQLLSEADTARRGGDLSRAAAALETIAKQHAADPRSTSALFSFARVLRAQGRAGEAAQAFGQVRARTPTGALAEDALAEEAVSWAKAGNPQQAQARARQYIAQYSGGPHYQRMQRLLPE